MKRSFLLIFALTLLTGPTLAQTPSTIPQAIQAQPEKPLDDLAQGFYACRAHEIPPDPAKPPSTTVTYAAGFAELCPGVVMKHIERLNQESAASGRADLEKISRAAKQIVK